MTIALGIICDEGITMGADEQYTTGLIKTPGQKIFTIKPTDNITACLAGAGTVAFLKMTVEKLDDRLREKFASKTPTFQNVRCAIEELLSEVFENHVYPVPADWPEGKPVIEFLMGVWIRDEGLKLFITQQTAIHTVDTYDCIGIGSTLAKYLVGQLADPARTHEETKQIATYTLLTVQEHVPDCGKGTALQVLDANGEVSRTNPAEIWESEQYFSFLPTIVGQLITGLAIDRHDLESRMEWIKQQILASRDARDKNRKAIAEFQKLIREAATKRPS